MGRIRSGPGRSLASVASIWYFYAEGRNDMDTTRPSLLLRIADDRDQDAWVEFDAIYRPILQRYAHAWRLPQEESNDIAQQCMLAVHKHIQSFAYDPQKGRFRAWLKTMLGNRIRNHLRARRERPADSADLQRAQTREPTPEEAFERIWLEEHLRHAIESIRRDVDPITFEAFERYVMKEEPSETVCEALSISAARLYKIKWRMTQKLRERMSQYTGEDRWIDA